MASGCSRSATSTTSRGTTARCSIRVWVRRIRARTSRRSNSSEGDAMVWSQNYDPFGSPWISTLVAAVPLVVLLGSLALLRLRAPAAAIAGLIAALLVAIFAFHMPAQQAFAAAGF